MLLLVMFACGLRVSVVGVEHTIQTIEAPAEDTGAEE